MIDDDRHLAEGWGMPTPGTLRPGAGYWWAVIPIAATGSDRLAQVGLGARLAGGAVANADLHAIELTPRLAPPEPGRDLPLSLPSGSGRDALVAIAMATMEPPIDLFRRQIDSIRSQTHRNWVCVISDDASGSGCLGAMREVIAGDERFLLVPGPERFGAYRNFERALSLVPPEADYVALADQDDRWHEDKLEALLDACADGARLAYSDMRVVDRDGDPIADTYWTMRPNNYSDFGSLLLANTVTGAASMFEHRLLEDVLPFPPPLGDAYHDHWIAQVAMALGDITYVDRPLHDYTQHPGASLGHGDANAAGRFSGSLPSRIRLGVAHAREYGLRAGLDRCFELYCRLRLHATVLEMRCGARMDPAKRATLARIGDPPHEASWLARKGGRSLFRATATLGRERAVLAGLAWQQAASLPRRWTGHHARRLRSPEGSAD